MPDKSKVRKIRGHAEIHAETHWASRSEDPDVKELVVNTFRVEHRDGSVEFASSAQEAFTKVTSLDERARRKTERKNPHAKVIWITTIEWHNCPVDFKPPSFKAES